MLCRAVYAALLDARQAVTHTLAPGRHSWAHMARGRVTLNGGTLEAGDGAAVSEERAISLEAVEPSEVLIFDLA